MSKGWTRRPSFVSRDAYDKAYEEIFGGKKPKKRKKRTRHKCDCWKHDFQVCDICQGVDPKKPKKDRMPDGCQIADVMTQGFHDGRSRA